MDTSRCTYLTPAILLMIFLASINLSNGKLVIRLRANLECPASGYFRDETDCTRFYRCSQHPTQVGHSGKQQYMKAQFRCPDGTIFDELLSNCNHLIFVKNLPPECGISGGGSSTERPTTTTSRSTTQAPRPTPTTPAPRPTPTSTTQPPPSSQYPFAPDQVNPSSAMFPLTPNIPHPSQIVQVNVQQPPSPPQQPGLQLMMPSGPIMPIIPPPSQLQIGDGNGDSSPNQHNATPDQNLQNIESSPSTSSNPDSSNLAGGWLIPASFPSASSSSPSGWIVPEKFPTLYSLVSAPFLLPQQGFIRNGAKRIELYL